MNTVDLLAKENNEQLIAFLKTHDHIIELHNLKIANLVANERDLEHRIEKHKDLGRMRKQYSRALRLNQSLLLIVVLLLISITYYSLEKKDVKNGIEHNRPNPISPIIADSRKQRGNHSVCSRARS